MRRARFTHRLALGVGASLLLALAACSDSDVVAPEGLQGTYALVSVNGQPLPAVVEEDDEWQQGTLAIVISQGSLTINPTDADQGTYEVSLTLQITLNGSVMQEFSETDGGTYTVSGNAITFQDEKGEVIGTVSGNRITVTFQESEFGPITLVFEK